MRRVAQVNLGPAPVWGYGGAMLGRYAYSGGNRVGRVGTEGQRRPPAFNGEGRQLRLGNVEVSQGAKLRGEGSGHAGGTWPDPFRAPLLPPGYGAATGPVTGTGAGDFAVKVVAAARAAVAAASRRARSS